MKIKVTTNKNYKQDNPKFDSNELYFRNKKQMEGFLKENKLKAIKIEKTYVK